jgi:3-oxoacyl-[acyl-carrier-protein] synthase III
MSPVLLRGPAYVLGEFEIEHGRIANLQARAEQFRMVPDPGLWGWGSVFRTERGLAAMATDSGSATLRAAGIEPGTVDALILCSTEVPGPADGHGRLIEAVLTGIGLRDIPFFGLNFNRCLNFLSALDVAHSFVASGRFGRVLVITTDRVLDEDDRMAAYALFSDGAASCVVTAGDEGDAGLHVIACASAQDTGSLDGANQIDSDLARRVNEDLLGPLGMKVGDVACLMHNNIFTPLVVMKERQAGFGAEQLWTANITRVGHCFAADPLINLVDRIALGHTRLGQHHLLAASVPGARTGVLLRELAR